MAPSGVTLGVVVTVAVLATVLLRCGETEEPSGGMAEVLHASPAGSPDADGSQERPFTLAEALDRVTPHTKEVLLQAGTYPGPHVYEHRFDRTHPVVVRSGSDEWARLDGAFHREGGGIRWQDIEFTAAGWTIRYTDTTGSEPPNLPDLDFVVMASDEFVNCIIHDHSNNGFWKPAEDLLVYGSLFYNQGWGAPDRGHGHAAYAQNLRGTKYFKRNVLVKGFSRQTIQVYGSPRSSLQGFDFEENVSIGGRWLIGGETPVKRLSMTGNHIQGVTQLGYDTTVVNRDARVLDNVVSQRIVRRGKWTSYHERGTLYSTGLDTVYVYDNAFDQDRGLVVVYNASCRDSVELDLTALPLTEGRRYALVNALDAAQRHELTYDGGPVALPMTGWDVAEPAGWDSTVVENTFPHFGAFLLVDAPSSQNP